MQGHRHACTYTDTDVHRCTDTQTDTDTHTQREDRVMEIGKEKKEATERQRSRLAETDDRWSCTKKNRRKREREREREREERETEWKT